MNKIMKIGIFGGSFDPIHYGHLMLANFAKHELKLDKVIFVPSYKSPKNYKTGTTDYKHRLNMLELALTNESGFEISDVEIKRRKISYTIDTVKYFKKRYPKYKLYLIIGNDCLITFDSWKNSEKISKFINVKFGINILGFIDSSFYCPKIDIHSTLIRELISKNRPIKYLVPESVKDYIEYYKVYKRR